VRKETNSANSAIPMMADFIGKQLVNTETPAGDNFRSETLTP
jgi:hypothetical protein